MRNTVFSYLLSALFASLSLTANASSTPSAPTSNTPITVPHATAGQSSLKVDLNSADAQMLQSQLDGIGRAKAEAIVAYREVNGRFTSVDELLEVKGIGSSLLERNRDKLKVE